MIVYYHSYQLVEHAVIALSSGYVMSEVEIECM